MRTRRLETILSQDGVLTLHVPRHLEVNERLARKIIKDLTEK